VIFIPTMIKMIRMEIEVKTEIATIPERLTRFVQLRRESIISF